MRATWWRDARLWLLLGAMAAALGLPSATAAQAPAPPPEEAHDLGRVYSLPI